jgi:branched-chain amino acid aminotransferase
LQIQERKDKLHKPDTSRTNPYTFGKIFTDHMLTIDYTNEKGWHAPKIEARAPFPLATTATSLHYGISAFEGLAIFKNEKNGKP